MTLKKKSAKPQKNLKIKRGNTVLTSFQQIYKLKIEPKKDLLK